MKIKTQDLIDLALDYACIVAGAWTRADGGAVTSEDAVALILDDEIDTSYSTDWSQGGPLIEREGIQLHIDNDWVARKVEVDYDAPDMPDEYPHGPTPLIAAMRCFVASKLGEEIEIPEELL